MRLGRVWLASFCLALVCATPAHAKKSVASEESIEREIEITAQIHDQIRRQAPLINDPIILDFLYGIGGEIVQATEPQPFIYRFFIIDDDELNAFTIGGGYVYLNREVIAQAGDINELAGVLAHEIAHVRQRHIARKAEGSSVTTLATLASLLAVAAGADPEVMLLAQGLNQSLQIQHTRRHEQEADREGLAYMVQTGYEPMGMTRFFQRILAAHPNRGDGIPSYLFTHPALDQRVSSARVELKRIGAPKNIRRSDARLAEIQARLAQWGHQGTGLQARAEFNRTLTDDLLTQARGVARDGRPDYADELLQRAEQLEPGDPRVPLQRADLAEERGDLEAARDQLTRAWELDPRVPLVQYRLGSVLRKLGNRSRAVFFLEQAAASFRPDSSLYQRVRFELRQLEFPLLARSGFDPEGPVYRVGEPIRWYGEVDKRYLDSRPSFDVEWRTPLGEVAQRERIPMGKQGKVSSLLLPEDRSPVGTWSVRVRVRDVVVDQRRFELRSEGP